MPYKWAEMTPRERDALVAEKVMGWTKIWYNADSDDHPEADCANGLCPDGTYTSIPFFTTDLSAAWEVLNSFPRHYHRNITYHGDSNFAPADWVCGISLPSSGWWSAWSDSVPEAICLAALKAVGVDIQES